MAINSVASSTSADSLSVSAKAQPERAKVSARQRNDGPAAQAGPSTASGSKAPVETPRPIVNAQGQTTGRIISTKA